LVLKARQIIAVCGACYLPSQKRTSGKRRSQDLRNFHDHMFAGSEPIADGSAVMACRGAVCRYSGVWCPRPLQQKRTIDRDQPLDRISEGASPEISVVAYCQGTPLRNEIGALDPDGLEVATDQATQALTRRFGDCRIEGRIRAFVITAK
jgi:hypothetical protein